MKLIWQWFKDVGTVAGLCLKLLISKKWIWLFFVVAGVFYMALLSGFTKAAEEESRLTLAVVWEQEDSEAESLAEFLKEQPVLNVVERTKEEGLTDLRQGKAAAVLVIEEGYGSWLRGEARLTGGKKPLTFCYQEGQTEAKILAELVSGGVLKRYCLYQSYEAYQQTGLEFLTWEEYQEGAERYQNEEAAGALMEMQQQKPTGTSEAVLPGTEAIYLQVVLGMLAGLLILLAFLLYAGGGEQGAPDRSGVGSLSKSAALTGNFLYVCLLEFLVGMVLLAVFFWKGSHYGQSVAEAGEAFSFCLKLLDAGGGVLLPFVLITSLLFLFLREGTGTRERFLAAGMGVCAILMIMALIRTAASFLPETLEQAVRWSPGGWLVDRLLAVLYR